MTSPKSIDIPSGRFPIERRSEAGRAPEGKSRAAFSEAVTDAVEALDETLSEADRQAARLAVGEGNLHETAIALEKADVAMRLAVRVRNKVVEAYQEIMRMPV